MRADRTRNQPAVLASPVFAVILAALLSGFVVEPIAAIRQIIDDARAALSVSVREGTILAQSTDRTPTPGAPIPVTGVFDGD